MFMFFCKLMIDREQGSKNRNVKKIILPYNITVFQEILFI